MFEYYVVYVLLKESFDTDQDNQRWAMGSPGFEHAIGRYTTEEEAQKVVEILKRTGIYRQGIVDLMIQKMSHVQMVNDYCKEYDPRNGQAGYQQLSQMADRIFQQCQNNRFYPEAMICATDDPDESVAPQETKDLENYLDL